MRTLTPYSKDIFEFHKSVVSRKRKREGDPNYKVRLKDLLDDLESMFKDYKELVEEDNLESIIAHGYTGVSKLDLLSLYSYRSKLLIELKLLVTTIGERKFNICQMCTVEPVRSFDHIVPKEEFPEFIVNPINLFPCCTTCNSKKGARWLEGKERLFLNLYYDNLPDLEYINVSFKEYPVPEFSLNEHMLDPNIFRLLQSHYKELDLFGRFRESSGEVIDPLITMASSMVPIMGIDEFRATIQESAKKMQSIYGLNHWKSKLQVAVASHDDFESLLT